MRTTQHGEAWNDWGKVDPLYAILTDPKYRHGGGDISEFLQGGEETVNGVLAQADEFAIGQSRDAALDFGCGIGRLTGALSQYFANVTGVDIAPSMIKAARRLHSDKDNCEFLLNGHNDLRWIPDRSVDFVLSLLVLQHLESTAVIESLLSEFVRVLRPGGAIVVQLPLKVPSHEIPLPSWRTRSGVKVRSARLLRRIGVPAHFLYGRFGWVPQMTLLALGDDEVGMIFERAGATVVHVTPPTTDAGGTVDRTLYVTRRG